MRSEAERWVFVEREFVCLSLHLPSAPLVLAFQQQQEEGTVSRNMCMHRSRYRDRVSGEEAGSFACRVYGARFQAEQEKAGHAQQAGHFQTNMQGRFFQGRFS
jgi:hypothetical protein